MLLDHLNKYEELEPGGTSTPSITSAENNVESAISDVTKAVADAPNKAIEDLLLSVKDVLGGVTEQLKRANDIAEKALPSTPEPEIPSTPEPQVEVPTPKPQTRTVRRNGRKVTKVIK